MSRSESETKIPADLRRVLTAAPKAKARWDDLTPLARRDFVSWIESAKQPETRKRRIDSVPSRLASGKRRPCCFTVVPMNLYKNLNANPQAKAKWKELTPDARRDFTDWIDAAENSEARGIRIAKACGMIAAGKKRP